MQLEFKLTNYNVAVQHVCHKNMGTPSSYEYDVYIHACTSTCACMYMCAYIHICQCMCILDTCLHICAGVCVYVRLIDYLYWFYWFLLCSLFYFEVLNACVNSFHSKRGREWFWRWMENEKMSKKKRKGHFYFVMNQNERRKEKLKPEKSQETALKKHRRCRIKSEREKNQ